MITYTFTATIGQDQHGADVVKEFVIEAENFDDAIKKIKEKIILFKMMIKTSPISFREVFCFD